MPIIADLPWRTTFHRACFIVLGGMQLLTSRMLDARRIFAVGISLIFGLSLEISPETYGNTWPCAQSMQSMKR